MLQKLFNKILTTSGKTTNLLFLFNLSKTVPVCSEAKSAKLRFATKKYFRVKISLRAFSFATLNPFGKLTNYLFS